MVGHRKKSLFPTPFPGIIPFSSCEMPSFFLRAAKLFAPELICRCHPQTEAGLPPDGQVGLHPDRQTGRTHVGFVIHSRVL